MIAVEAGLWHACKAGCAKARERLILAHAYLVPHTRLRRFNNCPVRIDPEDLEGAGYLALIQAVDRFDPARGVKFTSYAIGKIRGAMLEHLRREDWAPRSVRDAERRGQPVRILELWSLEDLLYIDYEEPGNSLRIGTSLLDPDPGPEERVVKQLEQEEWHDRVASLPDEEREVLWRLYWLEMPLIAIGREFDLSGQRMQQIKAQGLKLLAEAVGP